MIIAVKDKERVVFGYSNLQTMSRFSKVDYIEKENIPIKVSKNGNIFAFSMLNRESDLLLYDQAFLEMEVTPKNIVREIIPYIKKKLGEASCQIRDGEWKNAIIISNGEHVYCIDEAFEFFEAHDYNIFSYSMDAFRAVLDETADMNPEQRIINAATFVGELYCGDLFPMVIIDTKDKEIKPVYDGGLYNEHNFSL